MCNRNTPNDEEGNFLLRRTRARVARATTAFPACSHIDGARLYYLP